MDPLRYFAYGSNLHPVRMSARVPSARVLGPLGLPGWRLCFHKRGRDGSAKCNVIQDSDPRSRVQGVVYEIHPEHKSALDKAEGLGVGYDLCRHLSPEFGEVFFYVAREDHIVDGLLPFTWYWRFVLEGAREQGLSRDYIEMLSMVAHVPDSEPERNAANIEILRTPAPGGLTFRVGPPGS